jgi:two-component system, OmpR family, phosphate regulon sensor histidine kinase PhoR
MCRRCAEPVTGFQPATVKLAVMAAMWSFALARLAGLVALGLALGLFFGHLAWWIFATVTGYLALQLLALFRLDRWLRLRSKMDPPDIGGVWGDVIAQVVRLHRRKRFHKQRMVQVLRELRRSTAALPDGVIVLSPQREILWFNPPAARLLGLNRGADIGLRIDNLIRTPEFVRYLHDNDFSAPLIIRPPSRAESHLSVQGVPYGAGQLMILVRDVTRQMQIESMRKDFVANASHELRTPLTVISGYLDTMAEDSGIDPAWANPIRDMRAQAQRMNSIVGDLLELSRLESTEGEAGLEAVNIVHMLERLHRDALTHTERPGSVLLQIDSRDGVYGSARELESAFTNIIVNALKYTPVDGTVRLRWSSDAEGAHFAVIDTGIGIPAEHLPRLTERFYRVDVGRSRDQGGSGLGLAIVKHALQLHGGWLEVQSVEGKGSSFICHFPPRRVWHVSVSFA